MGSLSIFKLTFLIKYVNSRNYFSIKKLVFFGIRVEKRKFPIKIKVAHQNSRIFDQNARSFCGNTKSFYCYVKLGGGEGCAFCYETSWKLWEEGGGSHMIPLCNVIVCLAPYFFLYFIACSKIFLPFLAYFFYGSLGNVLVVLWMSSFVCFHEGF